MIVTVTGENKKDTSSKKSNSVNWKFEGKVSQYWTNCLCILYEMHTGRQFERKFGKLNGGGVISSSFTKTTFNIATETYFNNSSDLEECLGCTRLKKPPPSSLKAGANGNLICIGMHEMIHPHESSYISFLVSSFFFFKWKNKDR